MCVSMGEREQGECLSMQFRTRTFLLPTVVAARRRLFDRSCRWAPPSPVHTLTHQTLIRLMLWSCCMCCAHQAGSCCLRPTPSITPSSRHSSAGRPCHHQHSSRHTYQVRRCVTCDRDDTRSLLVGSGVWSAGPDDCPVLATWNRYQEPVVLHEH